MSLGFIIVFWAVVGSGLCEPPWGVAVGRAPGAGERFCRRRGGPEWSAGRSWGHAVQEEGASVLRAAAVRTAAFCRGDCGAPGLAWRVPRPRRSCRSPPVRPALGGLLSDWTNRWFLRSFPREAAILISLEVVSTSSWGLAGPHLHAILRRLQPRGLLSSLLLESGPPCAALCHPAVRPCDTPRRRRSDSGNRVLQGRS